MKRYLLADAVKHTALHLVLQLAASEHNPEDHAHCRLGEVLLGTISKGKTPDSSQLAPIEKNRHERERERELKS
jgi:hypothetical protein